MTDIRSEERMKWDAIYASMQLEDESPQLRAFNQEFVDKVSALLPEGGKVLEAGCGAGWQSLALARSGRYQVELLDFSVEALKVSQRLFAREKLEARWIESDLAVPGQPEYDLVFNAGVLEHYTTEQQVNLVRSMASRSRKYVLVLIPNQMCYWYWLWRVVKSRDLEWSFGKEIPQTDLSEIFRAAGLQHIGQAYLGSAWTETFIHGLTDLPLELRKEIISIHRSGLIPAAQAGYLLAALGSVESHPVDLPDWKEPSLAHALPPADLYAALSDALALMMRTNGLLERAGPDKVEALNRRIIELQTQLEQTKYQLNSIYQSRAWKVIGSVWKMHTWIRETKSVHDVINRLRNLKYKIKSLRIEPDSAPVKTDFSTNLTTIQNHLDASGSAEERIWIIAYQFLDYNGNNLYLGGAERYILNLANVIREYGYEPQVLQIGKSNWVRYVEQLKVVGIDVNGNEEAFSNLLPSLDLKCQMVICSPFSIAQTPFKVPSIGISHGIYWDHPGYQAPLSKTITRLVQSLQALDQVVSVDTATINWVRSTSYNESEKCFYIPNFVDTAEFRPRPRSQNAPLVILFPRRLYEARGYYLVINILPELLEKHKNLEFHFVGRGNQDVEGHLSELVTKYQGQVKWYHLPFDRMHEAYNAADITLIPTLSGEGTSLSCLEALASGNAVVATHVGGLSDLILDHYNGLLIEPDEVALKNAINILVEDEALRSQLGQNGRKTAEIFNLSVWKSRWRDALAKYLPAKPKKETRIRSIVFPYSYGVHWDGVKQRPHHIAIEYAKRGYEVFWYNPKGRQPSGFERIHLIDRADDLYLERPILLIYYPHSYEDIRKFNRPIIVYDCLDDISIHDSPLDDSRGQAAREYHEKLLKEADIVLASSRELVRSIQTLRPDVLYIPNAVDLAHFDPDRTEPAASLERIGRPLVGYHGAVASWFDGQLVAEVARLRPQYQFAIIGPVSDENVDRVLKSQPNIHLLGMIPYEKLPPYVKQFDVGIMPFVISPLTDAVRPLKVLEYLVMRKPVVATPLKELQDWPGVNLAGTPQDFAEALDSALTGQFSQDKWAEIQAFLHASTWNEVLAPLSAVFAEFLK